MSFAFCLLDAEPPAVPIALKISPIETALADEGLSIGRGLGRTDTSFLTD